MLIKPMLNTKKSPLSLGVMTCECPGFPPIQEKSFCRLLCGFGRKIGLQVFVFTPRSIDWNLRLVDGYTFLVEKRSWIRRRYPLPSIIYDRCFYKNKEQRLAYRENILQLAEIASIRFLGRGLPGKLRVYEMLQSDSRLRSFIPYTISYNGLKTLAAWFVERNEAFLKPLNGSQGKGTLYISRDHSYPPKYRVRGRDHQNARVEFSFKTLRECNQWIQKFTSEHKYLIQPYLALQSMDGNAFDLRVLMQKNGAGRWVITGMAVREGQAGSLTSNLHGGGHAEEASAFLQDQFGAEQMKVIISKVEALAGVIPAVLERSHGALCELGIDIGIDRDGEIWILEVNSKPGRSIFASLHNQTATKASFHNPVRYARYLLDRQSGGTFI